MYKQFFILTSITLLISFSIQAQKNLRDQGERLKYRNLYLTLDSSANPITYFNIEEGSRNRGRINGKKSFALTNNYINLYSNWQNPIRYKLTIKDSGFVDERDQAINDFIKLLIERFGAPVADLGKDVNKETLSDGKESKVKNDALNIPDGFNNRQLTLIYLDLKEKQNLLSEDERKIVNKITPKLVELDEYLLATVIKNVKNTVDNLYSMTDASEAEQTIKEFKNPFLSNSKKMIMDMEESISTLLPLIKNLEFKGAKRMQLEMQTSVEEFLKIASTTVAKNKEVFAKCDDMIKLFEISFQDSYPEKIANYFPAKMVEFEDGKGVQVSLTLTEYKFDIEAKEQVKKTELKSAVVTFRKYDFISVTVSAGIFYGSTRLTSYGVSPSGSEFTVVGDTVNKSSAVTALFANLNFGINSRYFSPLVQLGIDPTKKRPYFLLGGGFSIPAARFSITAGGIWTWDQTLGKLSPGQKVASSTDLEKDIKNTFNVQPKGWYLGIQYNF